MQFAQNFFGNSFTVMKTPSLLFGFALVFGVIWLFNSLAKKADSKRFSENPALASNPNYSQESKKSNDTLIIAIIVIAVFVILSANYS